MQAKIDVAQGEGTRSDGKTAMEYRIGQAIDKVVSKINSEAKLQAKKEENQILITATDGKSNATTATVNLTTGEIIFEEGNTIITTEYYGKYVDYAVNLDGDANTNDWQIYYAGGGNIYLIGVQTLVGTGNQGDPATNLPTKGEYGMYRGDNDYCGYFTNILNAYPDGSNEAVLKTDIAKKWLSKYNTALGSTTNNNANIKSVAYMFDTEIWKEKFITSIADNSVKTKTTNQTEYMLGGVPAELLALSYNKTHSRATENKLYLMSNTTGYKYAWQVNEPTDETSTDYVTYDRSKVIASTSDFGGIYRNDSHHWLASPSAYSARGVMVMLSSGIVYDDRYYNTDIGFRPVVCLKSGVKIDTQGHDGSRTNPYQLK